MPSPPHAPTIEEFARRLRARELTSLDVVNGCLDRIEKDNPRLNAFIGVQADEARRQASAADRELASGRDRGPLHGVPVAIKDLIDVAGLPTTAASRVHAGHVAQADAPVIGHLRQAGAVLIGKTNLHEFAYGTTSEDSAFGPVRNPHDSSRSPGGSSGGSAVAVAAGMALASLGTDTGGSIRIPAAACGIVGLKPTRGEVSAEGVVPLSRTLDHVGPFGATVTDTWMVYRALLGAVEHRSISPAPVTGLRLGVPRAYFCEVMADEVRTPFERGLEQLRDGGVEIDEVTIRSAATTPAVYVHIHAAEGSAYHAGMLDEAGARYTKVVRLRLEMGRYILASDYIRARNARALLCAHVDEALGDRDALVLPTLPIPAPPVGAEAMAIGGSEHQVRALMLRCTQLFNVTEHPAVSLPGGWTTGRLPWGLQLVGRRFETDALMRVACGVERVLAGEAR